ncbi:MAG: SPFH domain-containing protein, partial [Planctomycetota bacterium]
VVTTFGEAGEGSITDEPGLNFKWPYPIQSVTKYDTRVRFLETRIETQQTADDRQIAVRAFCLWRVSDPEAFFRNFSDAGDGAEDQYDKAESIIGSNFRAALAETSSYTIDDLFTPDASASQLPELESRILAALTGGGLETGAGASEVGTLADAGIEVVDLGINNIRLPELTTGNVIERMRAGRDRLAQEIRAEGAAQADAIRSSAEQTAQTIRSFAQARADEIRALGDAESVPFLAEMAENEPLAIFLRETEFIRTALAKQATLVLPFETPGLNMLDLNAAGSFRGAGDALPGLAGEADRATAEPDDANAQGGE